MISGDLFSIGIDSVEIERFTYFDPDSQFSRNVFTDGELELCNTKEDRVASLAGRFAAKEAVRKCLKKNLKYNQIEILSNEDGSPLVNLYDDELKERYVFKVSLTHTKSTASAVCLALQKG